MALFGSVCSRGELAVLAIMARHYFQQYLIGLNFDRFMCMFKLPNLLYVFCAYFIDIKIDIFFDI